MDQGAGALQASLGFSDGILNMAALGFLGLGAQPPTPAIDQGDSALAQHDPFDLSGARRIQGAAVDLGAYEFRVD